MSIDNLFPPGGDEAVVTPDGEVLPPFFRSGFNYDRDAASVAAGQVNTMPSMTQQQFADEVDINTIVRRFGLTGELPASPVLPQYGDFSEVMDYQSALNAVRHADEAFMALPAEVRAEFSNNPQRLLQAVEDPTQRAKLESLGLLKSPIPGIELPGGVKPPSPASAPAPAPAQPAP